MAKTSVDSEATKSPTLKYNPRSESGMGFFPLLMRGWLHSLVVAYAAFRKWPITNEIAAAELEEALGHLKAIPYTSLEPLTLEMQMHFAGIKEITRQALENVNNAQNTDPKAELSDKVSEDMHNLTNMIFALASKLDSETLGLAHEATDAGKEL